MTFLGTEKPSLTCAIMQTYRVINTRATVIASKCSDNNIHFATQNEYKVYGDKCSRLNLHDCIVCIHSDKYDYIASEIIDNLDNRSTLSH